MKKMHYSFARWENTHRTIRINPKRKGKENWRKAYLIGQKTQSFRKRRGEKAEKSAKRKEVMTSRERLAQ